MPIDAGIEHNVDRVGGHHFKTNTSLRLLLVGLRAAPHGFEDRKIL